MRKPILLRSALALLAAAAAHPAAARAQAAPTLAMDAAPARVRAEAEPEMARSAVYFEAGGNGLLYTLNYDHRFTDVISVRAGMMVMGVVASPVTVNALLGGGSHRLELGAGALLLSAPGHLADPVDGEEDLRAVKATATVGYRYQPRRGGMVVRAGFTPVLVDGAGLPWFGLSVGYAF